ncbi:MAG: PorV/PorQ family protein [Bacteroidota bacterium]
MLRSFTAAMVVLLLGAAPGLQAQDAGAFARYALGARSLGMGGALTADVFGGASPYHNPALAPTMPGQNLELSAGILTMDRQLQSIQFASPLRPRAGIAAGIIRGGVSGIDGRDGSGNPTQTLSTEEFAFFLAFGIKFNERISGGLGLRLYRADLFDDVTPANSLGLSVGLTAKVTEALALGVAVDDLLARYAWDTSDAFSGGTSTTDRFPVRLRLGGAYQLMAGRGVVTAEVEVRARTVEARSTEVIFDGGTPVERAADTSLSLSAAQVRLGGEYWIAEPFGVRAGYDRLGAGEFGESTPSLGFALRQQIGELDARFDYAAQLEPFGNSLAHFLSLSVNL